VWAQSALTQYEEAVAAFNRGDFETAALNFRAAYEAKSDPMLLYNLGQALRRGGHRAEALEAYRRFVAEAPSSPQAKDARAWMAQLDADSFNAETMTVDRGAPAQQKEITSKWWFWTALGGGAVVVAVVLGVGISFGTRQPEPPSSYFGTTQLFK
jgi:tetratricopeptide (TPR) repeat protein